MKTAIQELIEKYNEHLKFDDDLDSMSGRDILKVVIVDLLSYKVKEKEQIIEAWIVSDNELQRTEAEKYYNITYKQD
jgi:hypothetical protein